MKMIKQKYLLLLLVQILAIPALSIESHRVFVLEFSYVNGKLEFVDKKIVFGYAPDIKHVEEGYKIEILDKNGKLLYKTNFILPILEYVEHSNSTTGEIIGEVIKYPKVDFPVVAPYSDSAEKFVVYNNNGFVILQEKIKYSNSLYIVYILGGIILFFGIFLFLIKRKHK